MAVKADDLALTDISMRDCFWHLPAGNFTKFTATKRPFTKSVPGRVPSIKPPDLRMILRPLSV